MKGEKISMKNSESKEPKPKVNLKNIIDGKEMREQATFIVGETRYLADRITKDQIATHADCEECNIEFEKDYTHQRHCFNCSQKKKAEKFAKLPLVDWDGKTPLCIWGDDQYFFSEDDIEQYCEDHEIEKDQLHLELCKETSFGEINIGELFMDDLHDDWEADSQLAELEDKMNAYLKTASTNTWVGSGKRVQLS